MSIQISRSSRLIYRYCANTLGHNAAGQFSLRGLGLHLIAFEISNAPMKFRHLHDDGQIERMNRTLAGLPMASTEKAQPED